MIFKTIDDETTLSGQRIVGVLQAKKIAQEHATKQLNTDIQCLRNYESACKNGTVTSDDFTRIMGKASAQAQEYSKNIKEGTGSAQIYANKQKSLKQSIQNTGTASKVAAIGVKALSTAGNMFAGMAISFAISKVIESIEYLTTASERAIKKTKELQQEISQMSSDYESKRNTLVGLKDEYDSLTSKIGENGAKASLSADEYERYKDITSEILGITPKLITGWDEESRAISDKNNLLQMSIELLDEEYQKSLRNSTTKSKNKDIAAGIIASKEEFDNSGDTKTISGTKYNLVWKDLEYNVNKAVSDKKVSYTYKNTGIVGTNSADAAYAINEFVYGDSLYKATKQNTAYGWLGSLQERITSSQENFEKFANSLSNESNPIYQWFTDEQIDELIRGADEYFQELARIESEEQEFFQQYKDQLNLNARAVGDAYNDLEEDTKTNITCMIDSFDYNDITIEKFSSMATDLKDFVSKLFTDETLLSNFNNLYKPQGENESIKDYATRIKTGIDEITSYCEENYPAIKLSFGDIESDVADLRTKYDTAILKFTGEANDFDLTKFFEDNSINDESEIDYWNKVTEGAKTASEAVEMYHNVKGDSSNDKYPISIPHTFSEAWSSIGTSDDEEANKSALEAKVKLLELAEAGKLTTEELSKSPLADYFKEAGLSVDEVTEKINKMKSSTSQLASMKTGISSISSILAEKKENLSSEDTSTVGIGADTLAGMPDDIKAQKKEYKEFIKVLGDGSSKMDKCRNAANKLATAYVSSNNFLANLTEGEQDYYTSILEEMGVKNAAKIVDDAITANKQKQELKTRALKAATQDLGKETSDATDEFLKQTDATKLTRLELFELIAAEKIFGNNDLSTDEKVKELNKLAEKYLGVSAIIQTSAMFADPRYYASEEARQQAMIDKEKEIEDTYNNLIESQRKAILGNVDIDENGGGKKKDNDKGKDNGTDNEQKQQIDWISRALDRLSSRLDLLKAKYNNLFDNPNIKDSASMLAQMNQNLDDQYKILKKTEKYQKKAQTKYQKKADGITISKDKQEDQNLKNAVREGRIIK